MNIFIKQEPTFESCVVNNASSMCCYLCADGEKIFKALLDHFRDKHFVAFNQLPDPSIIQLCSCPDAAELQSSLFSHFILKSSKDQKELPQAIVIEPISSLKEEEHIKEDDQSDNCPFEPFDDYPNDSDSLDELPLPPIEDIPKKRERRVTKKPEKPAVKPPKIKPLNQLTPVLCHKCPKSLSNIQWLAKHTDKFHNPSNKFKCTRCKNGHCKTVKQLNSHLRLHDEFDEDFDKIDERLQKTHPKPIYECDHCGSKHDTKPDIWRHISTHFKNPVPKPKKKVIKKRYMVLCQYCSQSLSNENLKRHIKRHHSDDKYEYKCDVEGCGKSFTSPTMLRDHKNLHLGLKPYVCQYCGSAFSHSAVLRRHKYRHTNPEKYKCEICFECFISKRGLDNHTVRKHTEGGDTKPFACDWEGCNATFTFEQYLRGHINQVHIKKRVRTRTRRKGGKGKWRLQHDIEKRKAEELENLLLNHEDTD